MIDKPRSMGWFYIGIACSLFLLLLSMWLLTCLTQDHFDYFYREYDEFVFPMTIHPDVSGRPHVLLMHER